MDKRSDARSELTNRLLDEGVMLVGKAASAEGISISSKTALRWCIHGVRGNRLESLKVGGQRMTSRAAFRRFIAATQPKSVATDSLSEQPPRHSPLIMDKETSEKVLASFGLGRNSTR